MTLDGGKKGDRVRLYNPDGEVAEDYEINRRMGTVDSETLDLSILLTAEGEDGEFGPAQIFLDTLDVSRIGAQDVAIGNRSHANTSATWGNTRA